MIYGGITSNTSAPTQTTLLTVPSTRACIWGKIRGRERVGESKESLVTGSWEIKQTYKQTNKQLKRLCGAQSLESQSRKWICVKP